ncbi:MAG: hypothetical protein R3311_05560, partial [Oceanisphaera sp.]|nr:hypothetical protein [Oceanisphaera sp.]
HGDKTGPGYLIEKGSFGAFFVVADQYGSSARKKGDMLHMALINGYSHYKYCSPRALPLLMLPDVYDLSSVSRKRKSQAGSTS